MATVAGPASAAPLRANPAPHAFVPDIAPDLAPQAAAPTPRSSPLRLRYSNRGTERDVDNPARRHALEHHRDHHRFNPGWLGWGRGGPVLEVSGVRKESRVATVKLSQARYEFFRSSASWSAVRTRLEEDGPSSRAHPAARVPKTKTGESRRSSRLTQSEPMTGWLETPACRKVCGLALSPPRPLPGARLRSKRPRHLQGQARIRQRQRRPVAATRRELPPPGHR